MMRRGRSSSPALIERTIDAAIESGAAIAALPARDTVKQAVADGGRRFIAQTLPREKFTSPRRRRHSAATFSRQRLRSGATGAAATDESALAELAGSRIRLVEGDPLNFKVTTRKRSCDVTGIGGRTGWRQA